MSITVRHRKTIGSLDLEVDFDDEKGTFTDLPVGGGNEKDVLLDVRAFMDSDVTKMLATTTHLRSESFNYQMNQYVFKRRPDGVHIINFGRISNRRRQIG